jgi:hypothetical protein
MTRQLARINADERGSVMVAVIIVMVVSFAIAATVATVYSGLNLARTDQNRVNAFQFANAGVDQALYRLDAENLPTFPVGGYTPTVSGTEVTGFTDTITEGGANFTVEAAQDPPGQNLTWKVRSTGLDPSGRRRLAIATLSATPLFVNGFFTHHVFKLTGQQTSPVAYDSSVCPTALVSCEINPVPVRLGTNDVIEMADSTYVDFVSKWLGFNMYGRATQSAADVACGGQFLKCGTYPEVIQITDRYETPYPPCVEGAPRNADGTCGVPITAVSCPNSGTIGSVGATTQIAPGDYVCTNLNLAGNISVGPGTGRVRFWVEENFGVASGPGPANASIINQFQPPKNFQIFQDNPGSTPNSGSICRAQIWALLFTPGLAIDCVGDSQPKIWGAVVADFHGGTGAQFDFHYDVDSLDTVHDGKFVVRNWRECPPGAADC